ncbi:hypothetical protein [Ralstonia soli]|uniref:Lipoprotein n=1 Tax=Ralstonia soli TaxID=2953896 RepID=A0ABT1ARC5_9RALS|nr:hypothetical protein [Ralstonia soli]MCO5400749.1 hypothetical protein [Ralstonia soli]
MLRIFLAIIFVISISGCAFHKTPYVMYEGNPPLSTTTVFSASDHTQTKHIVARITQVDGKDTSCFQVGCPIWVRVLPGSHTFTIRYTANIALMGPVITSTVATVNIEVVDMKPMHVYEARYQEFYDQKRLNATFADLGEKPKVGLWLGLKGVNQEFYPVSFE